MRKKSDFLIGIIILIISILLLLTKDTVNALMGLGLIIIYFNWSSTNIWQDPDDKNNKEDKGR